MLWKRINVVRKKDMKEKGMEEETKISGQTEVLKTRSVLF